MSKDNLIERLHDEARELLAAEFEAAGNTQAVAVLRAGDPGETLPYQGVMLRAIEAALTRKQALIEEMVEGLRHARNFAQNRSQLCPSARATAEKCDGIITKATEGDCD